MSSIETTDWLELNQRYLTAAIAEVREMLEQHIANSRNTADSAIHPEQSDRNLAYLQSRMPVPPALETLCELFALSVFERNVLLLCAGMELDSAFAPLYATIQQDNRRSYPTFSLALGILPEAHWSAISPVSPLRYWRMIEITNSDNLTTSPLRIDERILHYLT